jgi:predicted ATPase/DNA-binding CsgD family transcriptional regulator
MAQAGLPQWGEYSSATQAAGSRASVRAVAPTAPTLPASMNRFVGRATEIAGVVDALHLARLVTVTGPGGVGKTRLALEIARRRARQSATVVLVDLSPIDEGARVPTAFAEAVDVAGAGSDAMIDVVRFLAKTNALVVLDNCEHVAEAAAAAAMALLEGCPKVRVLATSRAALRLPGETIWALAPLALDEAVRLFVERAEAVRGNAVAGAEAPIERICARLEGLPLSVELAAARVSVLSPEMILSRLGDRLDVLAGDIRGGPARHRSLRATIEWSVDLLSPEEQVGFSRVSLFPGSFSLLAAEAVAGVDLDVVDGLVTKSLIFAVTDSGGELRYRMLETLRAYGRERLSASGEEDELRARHLGFYVGRAEAVHESNALGGSDAEVRALGEELDNLRAALAWGIDHDRAGGLRLVGASREAWFSRSPTEGMAWADRLLEDHQDADRARALGLLCAGRLAGAHQDHAIARQRLLEAAQLADRLGEERILAAALHYLGLSGMFTRDLDPARRDLKRSVELFRELDEDQGVGRGLGVLGFVHLYQGDTAGATTIFQEALTTVEQGDDAWGQGQVRLGLGLTAKATGDTVAAIGHLTRAVLLLASAGDATILGVALVTLAGLTVAEDAARALRLAGAAVGFRERIGGRYPPGTITELESIRRRATEALGRTAGQAAWQAGLRLDAADSAALLEGHHDRPPPSPLTARQLQVARLATDGLTNAQIAARLHLSERTIENHIFNALTRLGLRNRVQLATWITEHGPEPPGR